MALRAKPTRQETNGKTATKKARMTLVTATSAFADVRKAVLTALTALVIGLLYVPLSTGAHAGLFGLSPEQEQALGAQEHPKIVEAYGGEIENQKLAAYVDRVSAQIIPATGMPDQKWTVTTLDTPIVNAFALPGGYIYITRGLLALANSEAELAGVIGHEFGHVVARHTSKRIERSNYIGIGQVLTAILTGEPQLANLAGNFGQLYLLSYSRGQEYEADSLGIQYLAKARFDPYAQADFLDSLYAQSKFEQSVQGQQGPIEFLSTHPNTAKRVMEAIQEAELAGASVQTYPRNREAFLKAIDGMTYGHSEAHGYVRGQTFSHPRLRFTFTAPEGFKLENLPDKVVAQGPNGASVQFVGDSPQADSPAAYIRSELSQKVDVNFRDIQTMKINGMTAATGVGTANVGNGRTAPVRAVSYAFDGDTYFSFLMLYPGRVSQSLDAAYNDMADSFRRLSKSEAAKLKPRRIRIVTVSPGDTVAGLANQSAFEDHHEQRFRLLNGLDVNETLQAGEKVKTVVE